MIISFRSAAGVIIFTLFLYAELLMSHDLHAAEPLLIQQSQDVFVQLRKGTNWQVERSRKITDPEMVGRYLAELNQGEYNDWRLPTKSELARLFDIFDMKRSGDVQIKLEGFYWIADEGGVPYPAAWKSGDS